MGGQVSCSCCCSLGGGEKERVGGIQTFGHDNKFYKFQINLTGGRMREGGGWY